MSFAQKLTSNKILRARLVVALSELAMPLGGTALMLKYYDRLLQDLVDHVMCDGIIDENKLNETFKALGLEVSLTEPNDINIKRRTVERNG